MKKNTLKIILLITVLMATEFIFAQTPPTNRPVPPGLPIDGGIITLFAVAFGYATKKLRKK